MYASFEARFEKSNLRGKEVGSIPSPRNNGAMHSYETSVGFSTRILEMMCLPRQIVLRVPLKGTAQNNVC